MRELVQLLDLLFQNHFCPPREVYHSVLLTAKTHRQPEVVLRVVELADAVLSREISLFAFDVALEARQTKIALQVLERMKRRGYRRHALMVSLQLSLGLLDEALATVQDAFFMKVNPGVEVYENICAALYKAKRVDVMDQLLRDMIYKQKNG